MIEEVLPFAEVTRVAPGRPKSLLIGRDHEALRTLLDLHAPPCPSVLDVTYGRGSMWKGFDLDRVGAFAMMDRDPDLPGLDIVADFTDPHAARAVLSVWGPFQVVVFDPPHVTEVSHTEEPGSIQRFRSRYGLGPELRGPSIAPLFAPFLRFAREVLTGDGIVIAKIIDAVHHGRYQWQLVDFVTEALAQDFTGCDLLVKGRPGLAVGPEGKWQNVRHLRRAHTYWVVLRPGRRCWR